MAKWFVAAKRADFEKIAAEFQITPILARLIRNRDIVGTEAIRKYLWGTTEELYAPGLLKGLDEAATLLLRKIGQGRSIRIVGDYDADGICAAYILKRGLAFLGGKIDTMIPHRMKDGYGLNDRLVEQAREDGIDTLLTCDNGIAAVQQIELAKQYGMTVIITDHHEAPYEEREGKRTYLLPAADVIVDPKQPGCRYPFREICGATVAYKLVCALFDLAPTAKERGAEALLEELLEFAAFATLCDVMPLQDENRILVRQGLRSMQASKNLGLRALMEVNGIRSGDPQKSVSAYTVGYVLGPCLNASGRLDTAQRALDLLDCDKWEEAVVLAASLKQLNDSRKEMTEHYVKLAIEQIENGALGQDRVLVVFLPDCHESIAGIIAGRIRERFYRPVFVLTRGQEGIKGSARSIEGYHIYEEMTKCRQFFTKYGGHKMAAGLSMKEEDIESFRRQINALCSLTPEEMQEKVHIDIALPVSRVNFSLIEELELLEPYGTANPKPLFAQKQLRFMAARILGKTGNVLRFTVLDDRGQEWEMMHFGGRESFEMYIRRTYGENALQSLYNQKGEGLCLDVAYYPSVNTWQGNRRLQLVMQYYQ